MNVHEALQLLEDMGSDAEEMVEAKIYLQPPINPAEIESDGDSGEEETVNINDFNRHQLLAPASLDVSALTGNAFVISG